MKVSFSRSCTIKSDWNLETIRFVKVFFSFDDLYHIIEFTQLLAKVLTFYPLITVAMDTSSAL